MALVTAEQLADYLDLSTDDPRYPHIHGILDAATEKVEEHVGPLGVAVSSTYRVRSSGRFLVLPVKRVTSVTSVTDPLGTVVTVDARYVDLDAGVIEVPSSSLAGTWTVAVVSTRDAARLALAVKIVGAHLWSMSFRGDSPEPLFAQTGEPIAPPMGFAVPARALELMAADDAGGFA